MAEEVRVETPVGEEILPVYESPAAGLIGAEPGSSRNSVLVSTDSYEEIEEYLDGSRDIQTHKRLPSGTIHEIKCDSDTPTPSVNHTDDRDTPPVSQESPVNNSEAVEIEADDEVNYLQCPEWRGQAKHIFMLSEAGKPIYSRHGDEDRLATLMGVMQVMVSVVADRGQQQQQGGQRGRGDHLRCIMAGRHKFVFLAREHIYLVAAVRSYESVAQVLLQLTYIYNQIVSILTLSQLQRIFRQRTNYDLRRLLTGAEKFLDSLVGLMERDASFLLGAVRCLRMDGGARDAIANVIAQNAKVKDLVFAILVADNQLITLVRMKKYFLHPLDLHLIFNLVSASESFKTAESWTPICLPKFDSSGYLHGHVSYIDEACRACLLLLTVDRDMFFTLSECKLKIQARLQKQNLMKGLADAFQSPTYKVSDTGIPDLRHFLYKSRSTAQFTSPALAAPYTSEEDEQRVFAMYQYLHQRIHGSSRPLKVLFHVGPYETLLGWATTGFELYAIFGPLCTKPAAISSVNKLLKWIKREEERLFILNSPTF